MFAQLSKRSFGRQAQASNTVKARCYSDTHVSLAITQDILDRVGFKRGDKVEVFVGSEADDGKVALRLAFGSPNGFTLTTNGGSKSNACVSLPRQALGIPQGVKGTHDVPHQIDGSRLIVDVRPVRHVMPQPTLVAAE